MAKKKDKVVIPRGGEAIVRERNVKDLLCYKAVYKNSKNDSYYCSYNGHRQDYETGKTYSIDSIDLKICRKGFHACTDIHDCFFYYNILSYNAILECRANDTIEYYDDNDSKITTNNLTIVREIPFEEVDTLIDKSRLSNNEFQDSKIIQHSNAVQHSSFINISDCVRYSNSVENSTCVTGSNQIAVSKAIEDSDLIYRSGSVKGSVCVSYSEACTKSKDIIHSNSIYECKHIFNSYACYKSQVVFNSCGITESLFINNCNALNKSILCNEINNNSFLIFNKKVSKERYEEVFHYFGRVLANAKIYVTQSAKELGKGEYVLDINIMESHNKVTNRSILADDRLQHFIKNLEEFDKKIYNIFLDCQLEE